MTMDDHRSSRRTPRNYAVGTWWIEGNENHFEWTKWWSDAGDFPGRQTERVMTMEDHKVVTLSEDGENADSVELRVEKFKLPAWKDNPREDAPKSAGSDVEEAE